MDIEIGGVASARAMSTDRVVGIDLGTTYSLVAVVNDGVPRVLTDETGRALVPSWVTFDAEGRPAVGAAARAAAPGSASRSVYSVKRLIGKPFAATEKERALLSYPVAADARDNPVIPVSGGGRTKHWSAPEISGLVLARLRTMAETALGEPVTKAVVTVPAYFNDAQRQATRDAGRLAGLDVLRIVNEPTAAALAYGLGRREGETIAVYDLGGGTFDVSVLKLSAGVFQVLSTAGDTALGGDDFDRALMNVVLDAMPAAAAAAVRTHDDALLALRFACTDAKHRLTDAHETTLAFDVPGGGRVEVPLTRDQFEQVIAALVDRTLVVARRALRDAGLTPADLSEVVLVGGSTRVPLVRRAVAAFFERAPHTDLNPDEVVALGAAVQGDVLSGRNKDVLLLDVVSLSLGIETYGGGFARLIERNTTVPALVKETFTNYAEGQNAIDVHVLQGEREMAADNRSLARFSLGGLEPMPSGMHRIEVSFLVDADGLLTVTAEDARSGRTHTVDVKPTYGLTDEDVERMLGESFDYAAEDWAARELADSTVEAKRIIAALDKQVPLGASLVTETELSAIREARDALTAALDTNDAARIRDGIEKLDEASRNMAQQIMQATIGPVLRGTVVDAQAGG